VLTTGGGLVFLGGTNDRNSARSCQSGSVLAELQTQLRRHRRASTYEVDGVQYVAVMSGWGVDAQRMQGRLDTITGTKTDVPQGGVVWVFAVRD
jgi:alcohol dehydrogenase (cytochrome c)